MTKILATIALAATLISTATAYPGSKDVFVDAAAAAGGDGSAPASAYRSIRDAVEDINDRNNRFVEHQNLALNALSNVGSLLAPAFTAPLADGPSVGHVTITETSSRGTIRLRPSSL
jgi:hypothetical protein